ncbi:telomere-associated protein RIF1-like [Hydractinia symbiolongicarpus]|uniref:telomere-associated protein RIF1-like n=1 Tax=Hydractinia symbiolongicarpus TaxID=13093 RepID=UPI002550CC8A|nr:telomere-associated protein RIF1-like [Hydractinia symbiolongicarpus]
MTNSSDISESIDHLIKIIYSTEVQPEDKVDSYLTLFSHFQTDKHTTVNCVSSQINTFLPVLQSHIKSSGRAIIEAGLSVLGQIMSNEDVLGFCKDDILGDTLKEICSTLKTEHEKSVYVRCFWCLSHQRIKAEIMSEHVVKIISLFVDMCTEEKNKSGTIFNEGLKTIKRLCEQCPNEMKEHSKLWIPKVFHLATSAVPKNRDIGLEVIEASLTFLPSQQFVQTYLLDQLNQRELSKTLKDFFHNNTCPVHVLNLWACILRLIGEGFFELDPVSVTNPLLKIAEKSFASKSPEITLALNNLWRALIDVVFMRPDEFTRKMEKIFLLPLKIRYRNEVVANESLKTNWHLICKINNQINKYVEKMVIPLLDVYLAPPDVYKHLPVTTSALTPEQSSKTKSTARSPKSPHVVTSSTKLLSAEIVIQLLMEQTERTGVRGFKLEHFPGPMLSEENISLHFHKILGYIMNATETCGDKNEVKIIQLWMEFLIALRKFVGHEDTPKAMWCKVLISIQEMIEQSLLSVTLTLKILALIPEEILPLTLPDLHNDSNEDGLPCIFVVQLLLSKNILEKSGYEQERFFIIYERMLGVVFSAMSDQLKHTQVLLSLLERANSFITLQDIRWRLWSTLTILLNRYVKKTNDVNQGNSLKYDFSTMLHALTYPIKSIDILQLPDGTMKELLKVWKETYQKFCRAVNLLAGVELNVGLEEFCKGLCALIDYKSFKHQKSHLLLLQMVDIALRCADFTEIQRQPLSAHMTPSKMAKKFGNPLGNFNSFVITLKKLLLQLFEQLKKDDKTADKLLLHLTDVLDYFYTSVISGTIVSECTHELSPTLTELLLYKCSPKLHMKLEKLVSVIYDSYEISTNIVFTTELLEKLEDLIYASIKSERKPLRVRTVKFWNKTFGKSDTLKYSEKLKHALLNCKTKVVLVLPGLQRLSNQEDVLFESQDDTAQFAHFKVDTSPKLKTKSVTSASPMKIRGSFLHGGGVKSDTKPKLNLFKSPVKPVVNSPISKSPFGGKQVRRKLPISLNENSSDFVEIKDSPLKKKRLLTEHQKEIMRERRDMPMMYNNLDQSQDTTLFNSLSQDQTTQLDVPALEGKVKEEKTDEVGNQKENSQEEMSQSLLADDNDDVVRKYNSTTENENITVAENIEDLDVTASAEATEDISPDIVPSSQTQELTDTDLKANKSILTQLRDSMKHEKTHLKKDEKCSSSDDICLKDVFKSSEILINWTESACKNVDKVLVNAHTAHESPPLDFKQNKSCDEPVSKIMTSSVEEISPPNEETKRYSATKANKDPGDTIKNFQQMHVEAKIVVQKLPKRDKRKRSNVLAPVNKTKRRKSEGDALIGATESKENSSPKRVIDVFDFSQDEKNKKPSPVAGRTRRKDKNPVKHRHSIGSTKGKVVADFKTGSARRSVIKERKSTIKEATKSAVVETIDKTIEEKRISEVAEASEKATKDKLEQVPNRLSEEIQTFKEKDLIGNTLRKNTSVEFDSTRASKSVEIIIKSDTCNSFVSEKPNLPSLVVKTKMETLAATTLTTSAGSPSWLCEIPQSPVLGILKKRLTNGTSSPSPPSKSRRVSFQLPEGCKLLEQEELAKPIAENEVSTKKFTVLKRKSRDKTVSSANKIAVYPELIKCTAPIEKVLPSLTFSRGIGNLVRAQNILTVGDLSSLSESQIENLPFRSPKVKTVRNALRNFSSQTSREKALPKSPLVISQPEDKSMMDSTTPPKDDTLAKEAALLATPSRHAELVKPTSLFTEEEVLKNTSLSEQVATNSTDIEDTDVAVKLPEVDAVKLLAVDAVKLPEVDAVIENQDETFDFGDVAPTSIQNDVLQEDASDCDELKNCDVTETLHRINFTGLSTTEIFNIVGELDKLKAKAMNELRTRMTSKHSV